MDLCINTIIQRSMLELVFISRSADVMSAILYRLTEQGHRSHNAGEANAPPTFGSIVPRWEHAPPTFLAIKPVNDYSDHTVTKRIRMKCKAQRHYNE